MLHAQIVGATGYGGLGMIELLLNHPKITLASLLATTETGQPISSLFPHLRGFCDMPVEEATAARIGSDADLVVFATPDGVAMEHAPRLRQKGLAVIDYSGDFRFPSPAEHQRYNDGLPPGRAKAHKCPELMPQAVYGLPELFRRELKGTRLVGNPGCFAVAMILGLEPLLRAKTINARSIVVDGKTGISGAGKKPSATNHFPERNDNLTPYRIASHQHSAETEYVLQAVTGTSIGLTFVPHLLPVTRGILCTIYVELNGTPTDAQLRDIYVERFRHEAFIRVLPAGAIPTLKGVVGSNLCDIGLSIDRRNNRAVVVVAIDNLLKGQAGTGLQNINLMLGFEEQLGLQRQPQYP